LPARSHSTTLHTPHYVKHAHASLTIVEGLVTVLPMPTVATDSQLFPEVEEHPKAGILRDIFETGKRFAKLVEQQGILLTQAQVAVLTDLHRSRVSQLVQDGTFTLIHLRAEDGEVVGTYVNAQDVIAWLKSNPRPGTPGHRKISAIQYLRAAADDS